MARQPNPLPYRLRDRTLGPILESRTEDPSTGSALVHVAHPDGRRLVLSVGMMLTDVEVRRMADLALAHMPSRRVALD